MNTFSKIFLTSAFMLFAFFPVLASAAEISFSAQGNQFSIGEEFAVTVEFDTEENSINAIEGTINFPVDLVDMKEIRYINSTINLWVEEPNLEKAGSIKFSGITPGGFSGAHNNLFSIVFKGTDAGNGAIYAEGTRSFANNGTGTSLQVENKSLPIIIFPNASSASFSKELFSADTELPESFTPVITQSPDIFSGKYFLVFATQDKSSGVDFYSVKEGHGFFRKAESPYLLKNQNLTQKIYVKAVDKSGNVRIEVLEPQNKSASYPYKIIFAILLGVAIIILLKKIWQKYIK